MKKHAMELKAFQKKVQSKIDAMKKQRALELEQLLQKYQNIKKDLDTQHALEIKKMQKHPTAGTSIYSSRMTPSKTKRSPGKMGSIQVGPRGEMPASMPSGN